MELNDAELAVQKAINAARTRLNKAREVLARATNDANEASAALFALEDLASELPNVRRETWR